MDCIREYTAHDVAITNIWSFLCRALGSPAKVPTIFPRKSWIWTSILCHLFGLLCRSGSHKFLTLGISYNLQMPLQLWLLTASLQCLLGFGYQVSFAVAERYFPPSHWLCKEAHLLLFIMPFILALFSCAASFLGYLSTFVFTKGNQTELDMHWANYCPVLGTPLSVPPQYMEQCIILRNVTHSFFQDRKNCQHNEQVF